MNHVDYLSWNPPPPHRLLFDPAGAVRCLTAGLILVYGGVTADGEEDADKGPVREGSGQPLHG